MTPQPTPVRSLLQVKKRCRWLLTFTQQALAPVRGTADDPFGGAEVDANALGWALAVVTSRAFRTRGPGQVRRRGTDGCAAACGGEVLLAAGPLIRRPAAGEPAVCHVPSSMPAAGRHAPSDRHVQPQL